MEFHQRNTTSINKNEKDTQNSEVGVVFNREVVRAHRELKNEMERLKLESKIHQHINKILDRRSMKLLKNPIFLEF